MPVTRDGVEMHLENESLWPRNAVTAGVLIVLVVAVLAAASIVTGGPKTRDVGDAVSPGRPLDAVRYEAPTFARRYGEWCYRVMDRSTGEQWWLIRMGDDWVSLTIGDD